MKELTISGRTICLPEEHDDVQCAIAPDGGTIALRFTDSAGVVREVYLDRCIGTQTNDHVYLNAPPGVPGSDHIGYDAEAARMIEAVIEREMG
jgi:hypothetical protein